MAAGDRRLAAIMFTDLAGFTAQSQRDETGALRALREFREAVGPIVAEHGGREIKSLGDGLLIEFGSALRATECAVQMQERVSRLNAGRKGDPIGLRIGLHVGDVVPEGEDILGDAVNVASRLEPLAEPGGICVSGPVYEEVRYKLDRDFHKVGDLALKGLRAKLDVYRISAANLVPEPVAGGGGHGRIAVLPFANISPDPADGYLADGLTEELISVLSQDPALRVIARTSVMEYRGTEKHARQIGKELNVEYLLEGSVRKAGPRVRITAQLIEAASEAHRWSESYDRALDDVFAIQAEIAHRVAENLAGALAGKSVRPPSLPGPTDSESHLAYLQGRSQLEAALVRRWSETRETTERGPDTILDSVSEQRRRRLESAQEAVRGAQRDFERAISLDPANAAAYAGLADAFLLAIEVPWNTEDQASRALGARRGSLTRAEELLDKALGLRPDLAEAHASKGRLLSLEDEHLNAEKEFRRALALNPSYTRARVWYATTLFYLHRLDEAVEQLVLAEETDPLAPEERAGLAVDLLALTPSSTVLGAQLAIYYAMVGKVDEAKRRAADVEALPETTQGRAQVLAVICAYLNEPGRCLRWLAEAASRGDATPGWWEALPRLGSLKRDPRFRDVFHRD